MRLPLDVRSFMMHLMNIEAEVVRGQVSPYSQECPPVRNRKGTLRDLFEKPGYDLFPGERYEVKATFFSLPLAIPNYKYCPDNVDRLI